MRVILAPGEGPSLSASIAEIAGPMAETRNLTPMAWLLGGRPTDA